MTHVKAYKNKKWRTIKTLVLAVLFIPLAGLALLVLDIKMQANIATNHFNLHIAPDQKIVAVNPFCFICRIFSIQLNISRDIPQQINEITEGSGFDRWEPIFDYGSVKEIKDGYPQTLTGYHTKRCASDEKPPFCSDWMIVNIKNGRLSGFHRK